MQQFFPTSEFDCDMDPAGYDACVLQKSITSTHCLLPFQNQTPFYPSSLSMCQTQEEGYAAFHHFQQAFRACKPPCKQLSIDLTYSLPQYLLANYLWNVQQNAQFYAYYLYMPSTVKESTSIPSYGFISFIAEVAGWYNLFLGGSIFALWKGLLIWTCWVLTKIKIKFDRQIWFMTAIFLVAASGILVYILIDCITTLLDNPIGTSTMFETSLTGLSLSVCLPQYTSNSNYNSISGNHYFTDVSSTTDFWTKGNNLSRKIADFSVKSEGGDWFTLWNRSLDLYPSSSVIEPFQSVNFINSDMAVNFCHTVDLSALPYRINQVMIRAVDDVMLVVHLAGQLLRSKNYYEIINRETLTITMDNFLHFYGSEVSLQLEETSFQNVSSINCVRYNASWTYDDCLLDLSISKLGREKNPLKKLLRPRPGTSEDTGVKRTVLQSLYSVLLSKEMDDSCRPPCRSLKVAMMAEASTTPAMPKTGIALKSQSVAQPLPPLLVDVSLTIPELSRVNKERTGFMQTVFKCLTEL